MESFPHQKGVVCESGLRVHHTRKELCVEKGQGFATQEGSIIRFVFAS